MLFDRSLSLVTLLSLAACVAPPPPPAVSVSADHGVIRADTQAAAEALAVAYDRAFGRVRELVPSLAEVDAEVWEHGRLADSTSRPVSAELTGFTERRSRRIHVIPAEEPQRSQTLTHELIHLLKTDAWAVLPPYVEEGLCATASVDIEPYQGYRVRAGPLVAAMRSWYTVNYCSTGETMGITLISRMTLQRIDIDPVEALSADRDAFSIYHQPGSTLDQVFRGLGYVVASRIVERHGYDGFYALCERSVREGHRWLPAEWLLEAADLSNEPEVWQQAVLEQFGPQERASILLTSGHTEDDGIDVAFGGPFPLDDDIILELRSRVVIDHEERELRIERIDEHEHEPVRAEAGTP